MASQAVDREIAHLDRRQSRLDARQLDLTRTPPAPADLTEVQATYDPAYKSIGAFAPAPLHGESISTFRRRLATGLQQYSETFRDTNLYKLAHDALAPIEQTILAEASRAASDRTRGDWTDPAKLREHRHDAGGVPIVEFHGDPLTWMSHFASPARAVKRFSDGHGRTLSVNRRTIG